MTRRASSTELTRELSEGIKEVCLGIPDRICGFVPKDRTVFDEIDYSRDQGWPAWNDTRSLPEFDGVKRTIMNWRGLLFAVTIGTLCISCGVRLPGTDVRADSETPPAKTSRHETGVHNVTMPAGTILRVRIDDALSTAKNGVGDPFTGTLVEPVVMNGEEVLPARTRFKGHVTTSVRSSRLQGRAAFGITLDCYELRGSQHPVMASLDAQTSDAHRKQNIELIGGGAGLGALIGAFAGGGKGAAGAHATGNRGVTIAADTVFSFVLQVPVPL